jgi:uncharacterized protein (DUF934 family)
MSVIVTDTGFHADDWQHGFVPQQAALASPVSICGIDMASDGDPAPLVPGFDRIGLIRVRFAHYTDLRGFGLARRLRALGYRGRLRAQGHVLAHQYTLARRAGFDEVEISYDLARRQPQEHWRFRGNWRHAEFHSMMRADTPPDSLPDAAAPADARPPAGAAPADAATPPALYPAPA